MSIPPVGGAAIQPATTQPVATGITGAGQQAGAQPLSSTDAAAQDWESALRAAIGESPSTSSATSADPLQAALAGASGSTSAGPPTAAGAATSSSPALLLALLGGGPASTTNPLVTSLSGAQATGTAALTAAATDGLT
ncbi:MAG TPA: hypothetical protein VG325_16800 [Solirubrobacteraceae bacterium]|jgi:hypothetical protein|nr:hypothetical protein [Solirubrobacteraceae bacterium]